MRFAMIKIMDQDLDVEMVFVFMTSQIQRTAIIQTSVTVIITKNTSSTTKEIGKDYLVKQSLIISS